VATAPGTNQAAVTTPRYRRSSVRAVLETITPDHAVASQAHDALWIVLWSRRYDDVDEPVWLPDSAYSGVLTFARPLDGENVVAGVDCGESFILFSASGPVPPICSRVRVLPAGRDQWRFAEVQSLGLGIELRFDEPAPPSDLPWIDTLREGVRRLRELLDPKRERLAARRAQLGALSEPMSVEAIWREEISAISDRVAMQTEYTPQEHTALSRARSKGARALDEEQNRIQAARKRRFSEQGNAEVARFREERWPAIRDRAMAENRKYVEYRTEVVRLEEAMQRIRALTDRATKATRMLDALEKADFRVRSLSLDPARLDDPLYADEMLRSIELLFAAIPLRSARSDATSFSAYRAPTAGPSVMPPRIED
jgi:hypothetical protein